MAPLTPDQEAKLRNAGYPQTVIAAYKAGRLDPSMTKKVQDASKSGFSIFGIPISSFALPINLGPKPQRRPISPLAQNPRNPYYTNPDSPIGKSPAQLGLTSNATPRTRAGYAPGYMPNMGPVLRSGASSRPQVTYTDIERDANDAALDRSLPGRRAELDQQTNPTPAPTVPNLIPYPEINIPDIIIKDFSDKVRKQFSEAYAPLYEAVNLGKKNAQQQQSQSDAAIAQLYQNLARDLTTSGAAEQQQYAASGRQAQATSQALDKRIGDIYGNQNQEEAALARSLGQEGAAGEILANNATERQFQQAQAAQAGAAEQDYYTKGGQVAADYGRELSGAAGMEGASRRSDLINDLANVLNQYDQQSLGYKNQEILGAIEQGNVLSDRDLQMQQANVNAILSKAGLLNQQVSGQNQNSMDIYNTQVAQQQAQQKALADALAADQERLAAIRQEGVQRQELDIAKQRLLIDAAQAGGQQKQPEDAYSKVMQSIDAIPSSDNRRSEEYFQLVNGLVYGDPEDPTVRTDEGELDKNTFIIKAAFEAQKNGMSQEKAMAAASTYWDNFMGK